MSRRDAILDDKEAMFAPPDVQTSGYQKTKPTKGTEKHKPLSWTPLRICIIFLCIIAAFTTTLAQTDCPASVLLALARAAAACMSMERNQFCHGNGESVSVYHYGSIEEMPVQPGDRFDLSSILELGIGDDDAPEWNVATLQVQANLPDAEQRSATFLLFGNVYIANEVPPLPELTITSTGTLNVRALPEADADILTTLPLRGTATANGRTQDNRWLRIVTRNNTLGWASVENLTVDGSISTLNVVDTAAPFLRPFQVFSLYTGADDALCDGAPESGLLIQTPGANVPVELTVNGVLAEVAGTVFIQAQPQAMMTINVLNGYAEIGALGAVHYVPAGARIHIPLGEDVLVSSAPG